jgi:hypothetical protein
LVATILERHIEFSINLFKRCPRKANATGVCNALEPRCDVDPVAENIVVFD